MAGATSSPDEDPKLGEGRLALFAFGLAEALRAQQIDPHIAARLAIPVFLRERSRRKTGALIKALHLASEIEDVARLAPKGLKPAINDIRDNALKALLKLK